LVSFSSFYNRKINDGSRESNGKVYFSAEPRISVRFSLFSFLSWKISYNRTSQDVHLLSNASVGMPSDIWMPSDRFIQPQTANHYSTGFFWSLFQNRLEISAEAYYKKMDHVIDFVDNADLKLSQNIETQILGGIGEAYGTEILIRKNTGKLSGWIGYTRSSTRRKIEGINDGLFYPTHYDVRDYLTIYLSQCVFNRTFVSVSYNYHTGQAITMPIGVYMFKYMYIYEYSKRNSYRLTDYKRLDIGIIIKSKVNKTKCIRSEWSFSVYNVLGRRNIFSYYIKANDFYSGLIHVHKIFLPGQIPMIRYSLTF
jgi:hypothetical protein